MNTDHETQETPRGGVFHRWDKIIAARKPAQKEMPLDGDTLALVPETGVDQERAQAEERARQEREAEAKRFQETAQLTFA